MNITFEELRKIKHTLPTGSITRIASELKIDEQTVRNFFGANKNGGKPTDWHLEPGPDGGIVNLADTAILDLAMKILEENNLTIPHN